MLAVAMGFAFTEGGAFQHPRQKEACKPAVCSAAKILIILRWKF
ncbi:MAG: hypothetical protein N0A00_06635 [Candidatus Bathyarchaeota archaeon]|nr:hypothetical protein [Candidatus Bathyarchaeota archaeon]